jgi:uncharacterized membrane-anchored protein YitT (DUF2179 family)
LKKINGKSVKNFIIDLIIIFIASLLEGGAVTIFTIPNNILPGGISGISTALADLLPLRVGQISLCFTITVAALGFWQLGFNMLFKSALASLTLSLMIDPLSDLVAKYNLEYTENKLVAALVAGVIIGVAVGIMFAREMSTGGTDTVALVLKKHKPNLPTSNLMTGVDLAIVLFGAFVFRNLDVVLYSCFTLYAANKVVDAIQQGIDFAKVIYVISDKSEEISDRLLDEEDVGTTLLPSKGGYTKELKDMLLVAVRNSKITGVLKIVKEIDPNAFTIITNATEIRGEGFKQ